MADDYVFQVTIQSDAAQAVEAARLLGAEWAKAGANIVNINTKIVQSNKQVSDSERVIYENTQRLLEVRRALQNQINGYLLKQYEGIQLTKAESQVVANLTNQLQRLSVAQTAATQGASAYYRAMLQGATTLASFTNPQMAMIGYNASYLMQYAGQAPGVIPPLAGAAALVGGNLALSYGGKVGGMSQGFAAATAPYGGDRYAYSTFAQASGGTLSRSQIAQSAGLPLIKGQQFGIDVESLAADYEDVRRISMSTGQDIAAQWEQYVNGVLRREGELLDQLGIKMKQGQAEKLTDVQYYEEVRRQLDEVARGFGEVDEGIIRARDSLTELKVIAVDLANAGAEGFANSAFGKWWADANHTVATVLRNMLNIRDIELTDHGTTGAPGVNPRGNINADPGNKANWSWSMTGQQWMWQGMGGPPAGSGTYGYKPPFRDTGEMVGPPASAAYVPNFDKAKYAQVGNTYHDLRTGAVVGTAQGNMIRLPDGRVVSAGQIGSAFGLTSENVVRLNAGQLADYLAADQALNPKAPGGGGSKQQTFGYLNLKGLMASGSTGTFNVTDRGQVWNRATHQFMGATPGSPAALSDFFAAFLPGGIKDMMAGFDTTGSDLGVGLSPLSKSERWMRDHPAPQGWVSEDIRLREMERMGVITPEQASLQRQSNQYRHDRTAQLSADRKARDAVSGPRYDSYQRSLDAKDRSNALQGSLQDAGLQFGIAAFSGDRAGMAGAAGSAAGAAVASLSALGPYGAAAGMIVSALATTGLGNLLERKQLSKAELLHVRVESFSPEADAQIGGHTRALLHGGANASGAAGAAELATFGS